MTIFDYLQDIICEKKGNLSLERYSPYLINRWLSFINPTIASVINQTNSQTLLENKELHYKTMLCVFPKLKYVPKINYIKKIKEDEQKNNFRALAESYELSQREFKDMLNF